MKKILFLISISVFILNTAVAQIDLNNESPSISIDKMISVTLGGDFIVNGTYPAAITERLDQFVTRIFTEAKERALSATTDPLELKKINDKLNDYSFRDITLKRISGETFHLDLEKFRLTGDYSQNPYLKNDDVIIFAPADLKRNFFSITGAVNKPGKYHFVDGDILSDALFLAGGINKAYENVTTAEINRLNYEGTDLDVITVDIDSDFPLQRGDQIVVVANETQRKEHNAIVVGEVERPGEIPITKGGSKLGEVIKRAGGFTSEASLNKATVYSEKSVKQLLQILYGIDFADEGSELDMDVLQTLVRMEDLMMYRMSNVIVEDTSYLFLENELRTLMRQSSVDFQDVMNDSSETYNYIVHDGDVIIIPKKRNSVYVWGQVPSPGYVSYVEGADYEYYIREAGDYGEYAVPEDVMVIKSKGRQWISPVEKNVKIEAGDYVYVPREIIRNFNYYVYRFSTYVSILGGVATIILLMLQLGK